MRVAFFSDIHANLPALEAAIADARERGAVHILCLGDIVGYGPQPAETLARIREIASGTILGNHDAAACGLLDPALFNPFARETAERAALALDADAKAWLRALPYVLEGDGVTCAHGSFDAPETFRYLESKADAAQSLAAMPTFPLLIVGHTHIPCVFAQEAPGAAVRKLPPVDFACRPGVRYVVNPGSVGFPRSDRLTADYLLYDTVTRRIAFRSVPYDLAPYRLALVRNGYNPMNYWFLSPSARRRQAEQAFIGSARAAGVPVGKGGLFRARRSRRRFPRGFWVLVTLLLCLITASCVALWAAAPGDEAPRSARPAEGNLLPPLTQWAPQAESPGLRRGFAPPPDNKVVLTPEPAPARHVMLSPLSMIPSGAQDLRLSFRVVARRSEALGYSARVLFLCGDGTQRTDALHFYKRPGVQGYTIHVPKEARAFRVEFAFELPGPLAFINPVLLPLSR